MSGRAILLLAGYLVLFPPLFPLLVLGPLAGLLAASRPVTRREWLWIGVAAGSVGFVIWEPAGLAAQATYAWAFLVTAAFVTLMVAGRCRLVTGALAATGAGLVMATGWAWWLGTRWHDIELAVAHAGWEFCRAMLATARTLPPERSSGIQVGVDALADLLGAAAGLYPGFLVLAALPGLAIAWAWYHRIASTPAGEPAGRFAEFRFNDQLVWAVVLSVAVYLLPAPPALQSLAGNLALVAGGLYAARGAAVAWGLLDGFPLWVLVVVVMGFVLIWPVTMGGCFALGLADTWVDFRRRFQPADQTRE